MKLKRKKKKEKERERERERARLSAAPCGVKRRFFSSRRQAFFWNKKQKKKKKPIFLSTSARVYLLSPLLVRATRRVYHDTLYSPRDVCFYVKSNDDDDSRFLFFSSHLEKREED